MIQQDFSLQKNQIVYKLLNQLDITNKSLNPQKNLNIEKFLRIEKNKKPTVNELQTDEGNRDLNKFNLYSNNTIKKTKNSQEINQILPNKEFDDIGIVKNMSFDKQSSLEKQNQFELKLNPGDFQNIIQICQQNLEKNLSIYQLNQRNGSYSQNSDFGYSPRQQSQFENQGVQVNSNNSINQPAQKRSVTYSMFKLPEIVQQESALDLVIQRRNPKILKEINSSSNTNNRVLQISPLSEKRNLKQNYLFKSSSEKQLIQRESDQIKQLQKAFVSSSRPEKVFLAKNPIYFNQVFSTNHTDLQNEYPSLKLSNIYQEIMQNSSLNFTTKLPAAEFQSQQQRSFREISIKRTQLDKQSISQDHEDQVLSSSSKDKNGSNFQQKIVGAKYGTTSSPYFDLFRDNNNLFNATEITEIVRGPSDQYMRDIQISKPSTGELDAIDNNNYKLLQLYYNMKYQQKNKKHRKTQKKGEILIDDSDNQGDGYNRQSYSLDKLQNTRKYKKNIKPKDFQPGDDLNQLFPWDLSKSVSIDFNDSKYAIKDI